jgi:hypothetical protein
MNYGAIRSILLSVVLLSASWAAFGAVSGTAVSAILLASAACFLVRESHWTRSIRVAAVVLGLSAVVGLVLPAAKAARETARCMQCENRLKQIAMGVSLYHDAHGCYPLPCTRDKLGRPMHSWRLLILPYFTSRNVDGNYDRNEPWDSPGNRKALAEFRHVYCCPTAEGWPPRSTTTNYVAVVGRRPDWRHVDASQKNLDSQQQKADTFLIVEMANSEIQWSEPKDIYLDDLPALRSLIANSPHRRSNGYFCRETPAINAVLIDGDMLFLFPRDSTPNVLTSLKLLLPPDPTKAERRDTKDNYLDRFYAEEPPPINWPHCIGLPVWIVAVALLSYRGLVASRRLGV